MIDLITPITPITTRVAFVGTDELRFQGHRVFAELLGKTTFAQALLLGISGRLLDAEEILVIDDIATAMSSADPRMWPFKITRLGAAFGSASVGVAASMIGAEGGIFGANRMRDAAGWLTELHARGELSDDELDHELVRGMKAFGVLYRNRDERFAALMQQATRRGRHTHAYARLCLRVTALARVRHGFEAHVFLGVAALALDLGLGLDAVTALATVLLFHDSLANGVEGAGQAPAVLRRLPVDRIAYTGPAPRESPASQRSLVRDAPAS